MAGTREQVIDDLLCFDLYAASRAMTALYRPLLGPLDLTYPQYLVLQVLHRRPSAGIGELGEVLRLDYGTLTPLLRRLEQRGLIARTRESADLRAVAVQLTGTGRALGPALARVREQIGAAVGMEEDEVVALQDTLRRLTARIDSGVDGR